MNQYYRITAYYEEEDLSVIFDSNGRFEKLWEFSSFLVSHGFRILFLTKSENFAEKGFPEIEPSNKIAVRAIAKGKPEIYDMIYQNRKCKGIGVGEKLYGQFME